MAFMYERKECSEHIVMSCNVLDVMCLSMIGVMSCNVFILYLSMINAM